MFTWVEVSAKAIEHNIKQFRKLIGPKVLLMPVIKANAYGHGFLEVAKICQQSREVDRVCVVNSDEALKLLENGITKPIQILSFFDSEEKNLIKLIKKGVIFPIYSLDQAKALNNAGERARKKALAHLKVDTGAARVGVVQSEITCLAEQIKKLRNIEIEGVFSHFASSEEDGLYTQYQIKNFQTAIDTLKSIGIDPTTKHISCSAATALYPQANFTAVRMGLALYGLYSANSHMKATVKLFPALSWYTKIAQVKRLSAGSKIGYGGTYTVRRPSKLAIIPVGYWDGYDRRFSNQAYVIIKGERCPILGRICMNLSMVDVTTINDVKVGDKVTLIGKTTQNTVSADELAQWAQTINYEIVDRINPLLPRVVVT